MPRMAGVARTAAGLALIWAARSHAETRWARVGEMDGKVEVQMTAAADWQPAVRNLPLTELAWLRTGPASRVEIELDDGAVLRLVSGSLLEISDYRRLSTGQRIALLSLDRGTAYFTGEAKTKDALILAVPGAQLTVASGVRARLEAAETNSQIALLEGAATFSSPAAELTLKEGQTVKVEPERASRFALYPETAPLETDRWSEERDKALAGSNAAGHLPHLRYGLDDLDAHGTWITTTEFGSVWKPNVDAAWAPFRNGRWLWYPEIGYTWVAAEPWGWLPYHYGRWMRQDQTGWFWVAGDRTVFKPGEVYWLRASGVTGWGALAPSETWTATAVPRLYLHAHTTYAKFAPESREVDPASLPRPKETLPGAGFVAALPSPAMPASWLDARRPVLRAGSTRVVPVLAGVTFDQTPAAEQLAAVPPPAPVPAAPPQAEVALPPPPAETIVVPVPVETPVYYPAPVYTGIVVVNPPENHPPPRPPTRRREMEQPVRRGDANPPPAAQPASPPVRRQEPPVRRQERAAPPPAPVPAQPAPSPRAEQPVHRDTPEPRERRQQ